MLAISDQKQLKAIAKKVEEKFASAKKKCKILEEDIYVKKLGKIIERDYFPEIKTYRKYAINDRSTTHLKDINSNTPLNRINTDGTYVQSNFGDGLASVRSTLNQSIYSGIDDSKIEDKSTLTEFLSKFTSEDNASFEEIVGKAHKIRIAKHPWLYPNLLSIEGSNIEALEDYGALMIQSDSLNLFGSNTENLINDNFVQSTIIFDNTRFNNKDVKELSLDKKAMSNVVNKQLCGIKMGKIGADGKELLTASAINAKPILEGKVSSKSRNYSLIPQTPDVEDATPLMTWGNVENTPIIQDRSDQDDFLMNAIPFGSNFAPLFGFSLPDITKKEKLALRLTEKLTRRTREAKMKSAKLQARLFTPKASISSPRTPYSSKGSIDGRLTSPFSTPSHTPLRLDKRFKNLSPAASFLLKRQKFKVDILNIQGGGGSFSGKSPIIKYTPNRREGISNASAKNNNKRIKRLSTPVSERSVERTSQASIQRLVNEQDLTDNLLKLP